MIENESITEREGEREWQPNFRLEGLRGVYLADLFRRMVISLIGLFVPIYIWQNTHKLIYIPLFYFTYAFIGFLAQYPGAKVIKKVGVDWGGVVGTVFRFFYIFFLILAPKKEMFFWLSGISLGLCQPFDWLGYYYVMTKISKKEKKFGKTMGLASMTAHLGASLGPLLGALIIKAWDYNTLYWIAISILLFVAILPFLDRFDKKGMHVEIKDLKERLKDPGIKKHFFTNGIRVFGTISNTILWPIFLFFTVGSIEKSGEIQTLSLILAMSVSYFVGKMVDSKNFFMMYIGSIFNFFAWILRFVTRGKVGLLISNTSYTLGETMVWTPYSALLMARSSKKYTMEFWMLKEMISYFMMSISCLFYMGIFYICKDITDLKLFFLFLALMSLLAMMVPRLYKKYIFLMKKL